MNVVIREAEARDQVVWAEMRAAFWPQEDAAAHGAAIDALLWRDNAWSFIAETGDGAVLGFAEVAIRPYANGCDSQPVAFLEGIWVDASSRHRSAPDRPYRSVPRRARLSRAGIGYAAR